MAAPAPAARSDGSEHPLCGQLSGKSCNAYPGNHYSGLARIRWSWNTRGTTQDCQGKACGAPRSSRLPTSSNLDGRV
jgi:hypothetical protein